MQFRISDKVVLTSAIPTLSEDDWMAEVVSIDKDGEVTIHFMATGKEMRVSPNKLLSASTSLYDESEDESYTDESSYYDSDEYSDGSEEDVWECKVDSNGNVSLMPPSKRALTEDEIKNAKDDDGDEEWVTDDEDGDVEMEESGDNDADDDTSWVTEEEGEGDVEVDAMDIADLSGEEQGQEEESKNIETSIIDDATAGSYEGLPESLATFKSSEEVPIDHHFYSTSSMVRRAPCFSSELSQLTC
jgi:hypothetical protein